MSSRAADSSVDKLEKAVSAYLAKRSKGTNGLSRSAQGGVSDFGGSFAGGAEGCCRMCAKCGGAINLQPRPKGGAYSAQGGRVTGGELAKPVGPRPNVSFFGAGVTGGARMARMAGMGVTGGAGQSAWVAHVKKVAAQKGISYKDALKVASKSYRGGASCGGRTRYGGVQASLPRSARGGAFIGSMSDPVGDRNL